MFLLGALFLRPLASGNSSTVALRLVLMPEQFRQPEKKVWLCNTFGVKQYELAFGPIHTGREHVIPLMLLASSVNTPIRVQGGLFPVLPKSVHLETTGSSVEIYFGGEHSLHWTLSPKMQWFTSHTGDAQVFWPRGQFQ